jgi:hypothetical protein
MSIFENLHKLAELYKDDHHMTKRLEYHLATILPATLINEKINYEKRIERNKTLTEAQQLFIQVFLSKNDYFYLNDCYYQYDGIHYSVIKEDDIYHQLLSSISKDKTLMDWKHKTKFIIMKQIKERKLFQSIPETETVQSVLNFLHPFVFHDKETAKYFLTILGDNIFKKNSDLIFLVNSDAKKLLSSLDSLVHGTIGQSNITSNFYTKYHETYNFEKCRLLKINSHATWNEQSRIDMLCVAAHYSLNRYGSSENFILHSIITDYVMFFKNTPQKVIVDTFCKSIEPAASCCISWKHMHYIWKTYVAGLHLPNMIYSNNLKQILKDHFQYDEASDSFLNITSKHLPLITDFVQFWENTVCESANEYDDLELDEICDLFKKWIHLQPTSNSSGNTDETYIHKTLCHFFPNVKVIETKYVQSVSCSLWNKPADINIAMDLLKEQYKQLNNKSLILITDAYPFYLKYCRKNKCNNVNKRYFEKYIRHALQEFIKFDNFISNEWYD